MITPTHDEIAQEAQQLWQQSGCPAGLDNEIWLKAERTLIENLAADLFIERASAEAAAESEIENLLSPPESEQKSIQAAVQKEDARAPLTPRHTGKKTKPAKTGKPLWNQVHAS